jgi:hypothetical protein
MIPTREFDSGKPPQPLSDKGKSCNNGRLCNIPKTQRHVKEKPPQLGGRKVERGDGTPRSNKIALVPCYPRL